MNIIKIGKPSNRCNAFIINKSTIEEINDTYAFGIKRAIKYDNDSGQYLLDSAEMGHFGESCYEGDVVRYEDFYDNLNCPAGWNLWSPGSIEKASKSFSILSSTEIYQKTVAREAILFESINDIKEFLSERCSSEYITQKIEFEGNAITIHTDWGDSIGNIGNCYVVCYGKDDCNILTLGTPSIESYYIMDNEDNFIKKLSEI